nr:Poly(U)-specific endoribonuclease [Ipomoea batatas]
MLPEIRCRPPPSRRISGDASQFPLLGSRLPVGPPSSVASLAMLGIGTPSRFSSTSMTRIMRPMRIRKNHLKDIAGNIWEAASVFSKKLRKWSQKPEGETSLVDSTPPIRAVEVVVVRVIGKDSKVLVELHQELSNELGSIILRNSELNSIVRIVPNSYVKKVDQEIASAVPKTHKQLQPSQLRGAATTDHQAQP